jgi:hypothetical protein
VAAIDDAAFCIVGGFVADLAEVFGWGGIGVDAFCVGDWRD